MGEKCFRKVQYGLESASAHGTAVAATKMLLAETKVPTDRKVSMPEEAIGLRAKSYRSAVYQILADSFPITVPHGYFQALPLLCSLFFKGAVTASEVTVGQGDYLWTFTPSLTAANSPDSITLELGDDVEQYEIEYVMAKRLLVAAQMGQDAPVTLEAECFGKQVTPTDFTGSLSLPAPTAMIANQTRFYMDATWAGKGGTLKSGLLREASVEFLNGLHPKFHGNSKMMTGHGEGLFDLRANFVFEGNSDADGIYDAFQAQTEKALRLEFYGPQIGTGTVHSLKVDMWGIFSNVEPMGQDKDGDNLHVAEFVPYYGTTGAAMFALAVTTNSNSL